MYESKKEICSKRWL